MILFSSLAAASLALVALGAPPPRRNHVTVCLSSAAACEQCSQQRAQAVWARAATTGGAEASARLEQRPGE